MSAARYQEHPAFPVVGTREEYQDGITIRDYFAAKAMQSVILDPWYTNQDKAYAETAKWIGEDAYAIADAMLAARAK